MKLAFIGGGTMAEAMISGILTRKLVAPQDISVGEISPGRRDHLTRQYGVSTVADNLQAIPGAQVIILAVKPQSLSQVLPQLKGHLTTEQTLLSIVAGATLSTLTQGLNHSAVVRVMPNAPAQIGEGISVWTATDAVGPAQREIACSIVAVLGQEIYVEGEGYIDMATALSASGPAYVFLILEALTDAGVHIGLSRDIASQLAIQTLVGSARLAQESRKHPAELKNMVMSPDGTTVEGLLKLEQGRVRASLIEAVVAAYEKAKALGKGK